VNSIESSSTVTISNYQKGKVIGLYGLLGGAVGGLIIASYIIVLSVIEGSSSLQEIPDFITILAVGAVFGLPVGLLPALLTGYSAYRFKIYFDSAKKILPLFAIGLFSTFILSVWIMPHETVSEKIISALLFSLIGGASAIVTGLIALPKHK